jgi:dTDP-4-amino-4,6-dideoxygalactose transaminase
VDGIAPLTIPLVDLKAAFAPIRAEVLRAVEEVLDGMQLFLGPNVVALEAALARYCEATAGIGVASGTDALLLALRACGIGPGDEVVLPALTFFATAEAVVHAGALPVFVDVDDETLTIDPAAVRAALTPRTRAIVPVHLHGAPADMDALLEIARAHGLLVIEDAAQAHGARYRGRRCGSLGDAGCFSFYVTKNLGGYGEGGLVTTSDEEIARRVRLLRDHGHVDKRTHVEIGYNARLDEIQAAILRVKLRGLEDGNARRRQIAERYVGRLRAAGIRSSSTCAGGESVHHVFAVRVAERDELAAWLRSRGIGTGVHYAVPVHRQPALRPLSGRVHELPVTERACRELLSLPMYPELTDEQVDLVTDEVLAFHLRRRAGGRAG